MPSSVASALAVEVVRLQPGDDLRGALAALPAARGFTAGCVLAAVGSLAPARLRLAGGERVWETAGDVELLTLSGTLSPDGPHLHASVADADGRVTGGHVLAGCVVRTTAELVIGVLPGWTFARAPDAATGYAELSIRRRDA